MITLRNLTAEQALGKAILWLRRGVCVEQPIQFYDFLQTRAGKFSYPDDFVRLAQLGNLDLLLAFHWKIYGWTQQEPGGRCVRFWKDDGRSHLLLPSARLLLLTCDPLQQQQQQWADWVEAQFWRLWVRDHPQAFPYLFIARNEPARLQLEAQA